MWWAWGVAGGDVQSTGDDVGDACVEGIQRSDAGI